MPPWRSMSESGAKPIARWPRPVAFDALHKTRRRRGRQARLADLRSDNIIMRWPLPANLAKGLT